MEKTKEEIRHYWAIVACNVSIAFLVAISLVFFVVWTSSKARTELVNEFSQEGVLVAQMVNLSRVQTLTGTEADLSSPDYIRLKDQLSSTVKVGKDFRFMYIMSRKSDRTIFFNVDSEPATSKDYSPPGQLYDSAPLAISKVFDTGQEVIEGPFTDAWGTWVSAFIPLKDASGRVVAVFGIDENAKQWNNQILELSAIPIISYLFIGLLLVSWMIAKRTEGESKANAKFLRMVLDNAPVMMFYKDPITFNYLEISREGVRLLGLKDEEIIGHNASDIFPSIEAKKLTAQDREVLKKKSSVLIAEEEITTKNGKLILYTKKIPLINEKGVVLGILGISEDITEQKKMQEAVREKDEKFTATINQSTDGILIVDNRGAVVEWSPAEKLITGYSKSEALGKNVWELIFKGAKDTETISFMSHIQKRMTDIIQKGVIDDIDKKGEFAEINTPTKNGEKKRVQISMFPIRTSAGIFFAAITRDLTNLRAAQTTIEKLKELDKIKDDFLNIVAHELKTPLTSIIGLSEIINEQRHALPPQMERYPGIINEEGKRLAHVVRRILTVTRFEAGKEEIHTEKIDIVEQIKSNISGYKMLCKLKQVKLETVFKSKTLLLSTDPEKVCEVLTNLVDNAIKYGPEKQTITITGAYAKNESGKKVVRISVSDHGVGISPEAQGRLFSKFSQLENSYSRSGEGTGLGLYICKLIIEKMGGTIGVVSEVGKGSTFYFELPV